MILYSNNLIKYSIKFSKNSAIRINIAWIKSYKELNELLQKHKKENIFLDYPKGRTKPPKPILSLSKVIKLTKKYKQIKYFAVSNAESEKSIKDLRKKIPKNIILVPKIETVKGISNLLSISKAGKTKIFMLDKEDLYSNIKHNNKLLYDLLNQLWKKSKKYQLIILELIGVIFINKNEIL